LRFLAAALGLTAPCFFVVIASLVSDSLVVSSTGMILFGLLAADVFVPFAGDFFCAFCYRCFYSFCCENCENWKVTNAIKLYILVILSF
jgi:hypothetical protein